MSNQLGLLWFREAPGPQRKTLPDPSISPKLQHLFWKLSPQFGSLRGATSHPAATIPLRSKSLDPVLSAVAETQGELGQAPRVALSSWL